MINQFEVPKYLEEALPGIARELRRNSNPANVYKSVNVFLDYTFSKIREHNFREAKQCFSLAEKLYSKGNRVVQNAMENVYVYAFSHLPGADASERKIVLGLIPLTLYTLYMHQVMRPNT